VIGQQQNDEAKARIEAAYKLLVQPGVTLDKFESVRTLVKGVNPGVDHFLETVSNNLSDYQRLTRGEIIELTAQHLPENTDEQKKRKKTLLVLLRSWNDLQNEVKRVRQEFGQTTNQSQVSSWTKILAGAKGPLGMVTLAAVVIVFGYLILKSKTATTMGTPNPKTKVQVITFDAKQIPLNNLVVITGPHCDNAPHYHAKDHVAALAIDGTLVPDQGDCGYGKTAQTKIEEVEK